MENKISFRIDYPLNILNKSKKIKNEDEDERNKILERNIYSRLYGNKNNYLLEKRHILLINLAKEVRKYVKQKYPLLKILNISIFGSALFSKNPGDIDFLVITKGNNFLLNETKIQLQEGNKSNKYNVGISIKGLENFTHGMFNHQSLVPICLQTQIIHRTATALFRRHLPLIGFDFKNNEQTFTNNIFAQISDLLHNTQEIYYVKNKKLHLKNKIRSRKILSRIYEAISYLEYLENDLDVAKLRKTIYFALDKETSLLKSKKLYDEMLLMYTLKSEKLRKQIKIQISSVNDSNVLNVLSKQDLREIIIQRLKSYWKFLNIPSEWVSPIIDILNKYSFNEELAVKKVRTTYPTISNSKSKSISVRLKKFRKRKIKNIAKRIIKYIQGEIVADIGGRADDFAEEILKSNKKIKKVYVTDLASFTSRSKNPKISFLVQPSPTNLPFSNKSINTIIFSMVLHHLKEEPRRRFVKSAVNSLEEGGIIILIEDSFPKRSNGEKEISFIKNFQRLSISNRKKIIFFYDWFGNRILRNRDALPIVYSYKTMEEWKKLFNSQGMKLIFSEFIDSPTTPKDYFPPKAILIFKKPKFK